MAVRPSDKTADMLDAQHIKMFVNLSVTEADERTVCPVFEMENGFQHILGVT